MKKIFIFTLVIFLAGFTSWLIVPNMYRSLSLRNPWADMAGVILSVTVAPNGFNDAPPPPPPPPPPPATDNAPAHPNNGSGSSNVPAIQQPAIIETKTPIKQNAAQQAAVEPNATNQKTIPIIIPADLPPVKVPLTAIPASFFTQKSVAIAVVGTKDPAVITLQSFLNSIGYTVAKTGRGSPGQETGTFGPKTLNALERFQCDALSICSGTPTTTGFGRFGKKTKAAMLKVLSQNSIVPS